MSFAVDTREQRAQKYRLRDRIEVYVKPLSYSGGIMSTLCQ